MSISYQPKDSSLQSVQLEVQELVLKSGDNQIVSISGGNTIIDLKEEITYGGEGVKLALLCLDAGTVSKIPAADITYPESVNPTTGSPTITVPGGKKVEIDSVDLSADPLDRLVIKYVI